MTTWLHSLKIEKLTLRATHERVVNLGNKTVAGPTSWRRHIRRVFPTACRDNRSGLLVARRRGRKTRNWCRNKILSKHDQADRRADGDLSQQLEEFKRRGGSPICVGIVRRFNCARLTRLTKPTRMHTDGKKTNIPSRRPLSWAPLGGRLEMFDECHTSVSVNKRRPSHSVGRP